MVFIWFASDKGIDSERRCPNAQRASSTQLSYSWNGDNKNVFGLSEDKLGVGEKFFNLLSRAAHGATRDWLNARS